ncbi:ExbD/TolR family protein [Lentisalinibacter sediminis]|uniref:ExbD/TolR family protein n=1 Tax=Lentisalinibacter sediminis TaxID=2992237 RepID=UPI00386FAF0B
MALHSNRAKRMDRRHKRSKGATALNLVSLMDIFTILVFFLLVNSAEVEVLPNAKDLQLPESIAEQKAEETVVILVSETEILVQGTPVITIEEAMARDTSVLEPLKAALQSQNDRVLRKTADAEIAQRAVTIMGDRDIPYRLLKKVMRTCSDADYGRISLAVLQKSSEQLAQVTGTGA